jgi:nucleotide-binding universal stress UspA family protein
MNTGHPVLVGVDESREAWEAVPISAALARRTGSDLHVVHATRDVWSAVRHITMAAAAAASSSPLGDISALDERMVTLARERVRQRLVAMPDLAPSPTLDVAVGLAADVISQQAHAVDAGLVVVGAKKHGLLGRWLGGSTAHALVRDATRPVLVTVAPPTVFSHILVAIDLSDCARCVVDLACALARDLDATLRVIHVVEPLPADARRHAGISQKDFYQLSCEVCDDLMAAAIDDDVERVLREGDIVPVLQHEVEEWGADLLVVGSHGASRMTRLVLGSTTETFLKDLPVSTLFVPPPDDPAPSLSGGSA